MSTPSCELFSVVDSSRRPTPTRKPARSTTRRPNCSSPSWGSIRSRNFHTFHRCSPTVLRDSMTSDSSASDDGERLQKVMAAAGVASRRVSEDLISAGRVEVNGTVVTELGRRVHAETDLIAVDGVAVQLDTSRRYLMLNKPVGIVSSLADENGRPDLSKYTSRYEERLFNVGRLDVQTSGLLVLTNDGE